MSEKIHGKHSLYNVNIANGNEHFGPEYYSRDNIIIKSKLINPSINIQSDNNYSSIIKP